MPFGGMELVIILVIVIILFGPSQLPKIGKMIGQTTRSIREGMEPPAEEARQEKPKPKKPAPEIQPSDQEEPGDEDEDA